MRIKTRVLTTTISLLIVIAGTVASVAVFSIKKDGEDQIETFRYEEMAKVKANLKNLVELAHESIRFNYQTTTNKELLEDSYGRRLMDMVDLAYKTVETNWRNSTDKSYLQGQYGARLKGIIDLSESILLEKARQAREGALPLPEAKRQAIEAIRQMRYENGTGYVWINDTGRPYPKMVMHPTAPALEGKVMDDPKYNCALGTKTSLFTAFLDVAERQREGFVDYLWPKPLPDGLTAKEQPKLSYVRLFEEWGWILGTGIYVDDAVTNARKRSLADIKKMRYDSGSGYFWVNDTERPFPTMLMHPTVPAMVGKVMDDKKYYCLIDSDGHLFAAFLNACEKDKAGFVHYRWPKPKPDGSLSPETPKLSYVRVFEPWNWIIGTGLYVDDARERAQARSKEELRKMRYDNGSGYFWINDMKKPYPTMLMHPTVPGLVGNIMDDKKYFCLIDSNEHLFTAFLRACDEDGAGFVRYRWPKPSPDGTLLPDVPKISYVKRFKPWNWIVGTGVYTQDIDEAILAREGAIRAQVQDLVLRIVWITGLVIVLGVFLCLVAARSITDPIHKLISAMLEVKETGRSSIKVALSGSSELRQLGSIYNDMLETISTMLAAIEERNRTLKVTNTAYKRFLPDDFLEMLDKKSLLDFKLGDQIEQVVTVMFSDIRGYTSLAESMDPSENFDFINAYLARIGPIIRGNGGCIVQFYGDGIVAIFPAELADAPVKTALQMHKSVRQYSLERQEMGQVPLDIGIGLHTGTIILGIRGDNSRWEGSITGDTVNLAARLEGLTKIFGAATIVSGETMEKITDEDRQRTRFLAKVRVKGKTEPVSIHEVIDLDAGHSCVSKMYTREAFQQALSVYFEGKLTEAGVLFREILEKSPEDKTAQHYLNLLDIYEEHGVPDGWDGVEGLDRK